MTAKNYEKMRDDMIRRLERIGGVSNSFIVDCERWADKVAVAHAASAHKAATSEAQALSAKNKIQSLKVEKREKQIYLNSTLKPWMSNHLKQTIQIRAHHRFLSDLPKGWKYQASQFRFDMAWHLKRVNDFTKTQINDELFDVGFIDVEEGVGTLPYCKVWTAGLQEARLHEFKAMASIVSYAYSLSMDEAVKEVTLPEGARESLSFNKSLWHGSLWRSLGLDGLNNSPAVFAMSAFLLLIVHIGRCRKNQPARTYGTYYDLAKYAMRGFAAEDNDVRVLASKGHPMASLKVRREIADHFVKLVDVVESVMSDDDSPLHKSGSPAAIPPGMVLDCSSLDDHWGS